MFQFICLCIFSIFAVIGLNSIANELKKKLYKKMCCSVIIHTKDFKNELEYTVRSLVVNYPNLYIDIIDDGGSDENTEILAILKTQYPQIKIYKNDIYII